MNFSRVFLIVCLMVFVPLTSFTAPSPWDSWRSGYTNFEHGESLRERGSYTQALKFFERARKNYLAVRAARPDWNQRVIADRLRDCDRQISELRRLLNDGKTVAPKRQRASSTASRSEAAAKKADTGKRLPQRLPQESRKSVPETVVPASGSQAQTGTVQIADIPSESLPVAVPLISEKELTKLKQDIIELKLRNENLGKQLQTQRKLEQEIASLLRDRKVAGDKYMLLEKRYKSLELELQKPGDRIAALEQQLLNERLSVERLEKRLTGAEQQLKIEKENSRSNQIARKSLENLLKQRNEELLRSGQQIAAAGEKLKIAGELNEIIGDLKKQLSDLKNDIAALNEKNSSLRKENETLLAENKILIGKNTGLTNRGKELEGEKRQADEKNHKLADENRDLSGKNRQLTEKNSALTGEISGLSEKIAALNDLMKRREQEIAELRENTGKLIAAASDSKVDKERLLAAMDEESAKLRRHASALESQITALKRQVNMMENQISNGKNKFADLQKNLSEQVNISSEKDLQLQSARQQLTLKDRQLILKEQQLNSSREQLQQLESRFASQEEALAGMKSLTQTLQKKVEDSAGKIIELRKERDNIGSELRAAKENINLLAAGKRSLQLNLEQEKNSSKLNAAELAGLRERNRTLEEDVKMLYQRSSEFEKRLATRNSEDFQAAAAARNSVKKLENDLLAAQKELVSLRSEIDSGRNTVGELERKLKAVNDENLKARSEVIAASEKEKNMQQELSALRPVKVQYEQLQRDFKALAAENRENRLLVEAAKPRQAELEKAKLRLLDNDRLKNELAREQQLNGELKEACTKAQNELSVLRKRAAEFDAVRRQVVELEAKAKEADRLQNVEKELTVLRERETELTRLKIKFAEVSSALNNSRAALVNLENERKRIAGEYAALQKKNIELQKINRTNKELEAMLATQNAELDRLNRQLSAAAGREKMDLHVSCRMEADKLRVIAASVGQLNDQIRQLQGELMSLQKRHSQLVFQQQKDRRTINLKDGEIAQLRRLNSELAEIRRKSAEALLEKVDASKVSRLEDELSSLNKLNAELVAERDKLAAQLENRDDGSNEKPVEPLQSSRSPEEIAGDGFVAEKDGKSELAIWFYRQALANNPEFTPAHLRLGMLFYRRGSFADAVPHLKAALAADPGNRDLAIAAARCYIAVSRFGNAKTVVDQWLQKNPEDPGFIMCSALIDAGCGVPAKAEEKLLTAARLAPKAAEIQLELARLLTSSLSDRRSEAVLAYEKARDLGAVPEPSLEKELGSMLDDRRQLVAFMSGAAREAEISGDWLSAVWYYKKIVAEKHPGYIPLLAFAQWKSGNSSAAKETLEFNSPSRNAMVVRFFIANAEKDDVTAMRSAQQSAGTRIPADWVGVNVELEKLRKQRKLSAAAKVLLKSLQR